MIRRSKLQLRTIRVPVRYVDGNWESDFGGGVPVKEGAAAELVVERDSITDKSFLRVMETEALYPVLREGTQLQVMLHIKPSHRPSRELANCLSPYASGRFELSPTALGAENKDTLHLVEVAIGKPSDRQIRRLGTAQGGLWLRTRGLKALGLITTTIALPDVVSSEPVSSLNHAFTKLSETFETWRISHTGNIYTHVLYQEGNGVWCPLDVLRNQALVKQEHAIAEDLWANFLASIKQLTLDT